MAIVDWSSEVDEANDVSMASLSYGHVAVRFGKIGWHNMENLGDMCDH